MIFIRALTAASLSLALSATAAAFDLDHTEGRLSLDKTPQRIVSYDLAQLDTLNALGIEVVGVPKSSYAGSLETYKDAPVVGTLFEPDYDALKELQPDFIIAGGRSAAAMPELAKLAPTVSLPNDPNHFLASVEDSALSIGRAWGREAQAREAYAALQAKVADLHAVTQAKTGVLLFVVNGNVIAHAPGDRFGYVYELTGLSPVLPARTPDELGQPRPKPGTPEAAQAAKKRAADVARVVEANPDWLIVLDRGAINNGEKTAEDTLAKHPGLSQTAAFRQGRVYYAEPNSWYVVTAGLNNLGDIVDDMVQAIR